MKKMITLLAMFMLTSVVYAETMPEPAAVAAEQAVVEAEVPPMPDEIPAPELNATGEEVK